ncbi:hypothetical protein PC9H_004390 [Pleurotus ostreatus]|uniref:Tat pathway signal sequence protein n=1 Tax=Pleurotus ostreatus TaxID=5322 RepID=A0A8H7A066_PLEOS|nr:uncharacterized protein PC9H_004390 [Pleurotus ostreatus]KAF7437548.1 hypothetical protein PC9H_004390 [Pleurotus ostreatus]
MYSKLTSEEGERDVFDTRIIDFKDEGDLDEQVELGDNHHRQLRGSTRLRITSLCLGVLKSSILLWAIIVFQLIAIGLLLSHSTSPQEAPLYSPANEAISYKYNKFFNGFGHNVSPFQVPPSKELDELWEDLYHFGISRIPKSQAKLLTNATEAIPGDEEHYAVELDVFHELHCLNRIRKTIYSDHYPDMRISLPGNEIHMSHCLNSIRRSLMCSSDVSLIVWKWDEEAGQSFPRGDVVHRCRDFDRIKEWALENQLDNNFNTSIHAVNSLPMPMLLY